MNKYEKPKNGKYTKLFKEGLHGFGWIWLYNAIEMLFF